MPKLLRDRSVDDDTVAFRRAFGAQFMSWRRCAGRTREEMATWLGVSFRTVERWEGGEITPRIEQLWLIERKYPGAVGKIVHSAGETCG